MNIFCSTCSNDKRKDQVKCTKNVRENTEKRIILKKEDININFNLCHNCKIKKPAEFMVKCKNKDRIRLVKTFQVYNMSLLRSKRLLFYF